MSGGEGAEREDYDDGEAGVGLRACGDLLSAVSFSGDPFDFAQGRLFAAPEERLRSG